MFGRKKRIRIEFFDAETGQMIGFDEKKPKQIPPAFQYETLVKIRGKTWKLVSAEPFERKAWMKAGEIRIALESLPENGSSADSNDLSTPPAEKLFHAPSRAATFPDFTGKRKGNQVLELMPWEWRSIELIGSRYRDEIARELQQTEEMAASASTEQDGRTMYRQQHVRNLNEDAILSADIDASSFVKAHFPFATVLDGFSLMGETGMAEDGFAFRLPAGLRIYGLQERKQVKFLGLLPPAEEHRLIAVKDLQRLVDFMKMHDLVLTDWERCRFVEPILPAIADFFAVQMPEESSVETATALASPTVEEAAPADVEAVADSRDAFAEAEESVADVETEKELAPESREELFTAHPEAVVPEEPATKVTPTAESGDALEDMSIDLGLHLDEEE